MLTFYFNPSPNPAKVALLLEEAECAYEPVPIDTRQGEQFSPAFLAINPNGKVPVVVDGSSAIFDSNAILLYLAQKFGNFLSAPTPLMRGDLLSWLMFVASGVGPYCGQAVHFKLYAPEPKAYPENRYVYEAERHWSVIDRHLEQRRFMLGDDYTIVDMALWGWARAMPLIFGENSWARFPNAKRLMDTIEARPAIGRVNALFAAHNFKTEMDEASRRIMFPQNTRLTAA